MPTYFLYARKSTDVEDKQVRSIEDQLAVLRALAKTEGLTIAEEFVEKQSAKLPGRPIFDEMLARIEKDEAQGIVCWKLDRLARNPIDGGQISWFLQRGIIQHIQTHDRSYRPADNILMMSVEFGMANQYILDLSSNVKRGLHEKVKRGEYPTLAPIGYINDPRTKTVIVDRKKAKILKEAFELYAQNNSRLEDVANFLAKRGIVKKNGKIWHRDRVSYLLSNPFYYGHFRYAKEIHEGRHEPIIFKKLFDKVGEALIDRGRPHKNLKNDPRPLCGLFRCGECGMMITAEIQKGHTYYRCTKKKIPCSQPYIREEFLEQELTGVITNFAVPQEWADEMFKMADQDERESAQSCAVLIQETRSEIQSISQKLQRLLDAYLDQDIERENYRSEKANLLSRKKSLEEKIRNLEQGVIAWLEPMREWIKDAQTLNEIAFTPSLSIKKSFALKIFGSNLILKDKKVEGMAQKQWTALCAVPVGASKIRLCLNVVPSRGIEPLF